ncbi:MAG: hypothetical protein GWP06_04475 [Actinobacteria bacterium]|nr:hypothetical protein [Actinomycetota bacterium]
MSKKHFLLIIALATLVFFQRQSFAQSVTIDAKLLNPDIKIFMLSDFNFTGHGTSSGDFFTLTITNTSNLTQNCVLIMRIRSQNYGELASGRTTPFDLAPLETIQITNSNLFSQAQKFSLENYNIEDAGKDLTDRILTAGALPSDIYYFDFDLEQNSGLKSESFLEIDVSNTKTLDLIAPGANTDRGEISQIFSTLPLFTWESNIDRFELTIAEKLADVPENVDPEQVLQGRIIFKKILQIGSGAAVPIDGAIVIPTTTFQYPVSADFPLERGKTYYWQLKGIVKTPSETLYFPSEIWGFKIQQIEGTLLTPEQQQIHDILSTLLGDDFNQFFEAGGDLDGFNPTGEITINGKKISISDLRALLAKLHSGELKVIDTEIN